VKKIAQSVAQPIFKSKLISNIYFGQSSHKLWAIYVIFQKLPKANNRPLGKNSPNLVTLPGGMV
jgi:hypothetical protein